MLLKFSFFLLPLPSLISEGRCKKSLDRTSVNCLPPTLFIIGRTDAEAPILWPPDVKNWLIGKDPAGKDWRQEKGTTENEMAGWHHWFNGHQFGQAPGVGDGQGSLACCSPWGCKELDTTEQLKWIEHCLYPHHFFLPFPSVTVKLACLRLILSMCYGSNFLHPTLYPLSSILHWLLPFSLQTSLSSSNMQTQKPFLHPCVSVQFYPLSSSPIRTSPLFPTSSLPTLASPFPSPPLHNQTIWLFQVSTSSPSRFPQTSGEGLLFLSLYDNAVVKVTNTFLVAKSNE